MVKRIFFSCLAVMASRIVCAQQFFFADSTIYFLPTHSDGSRLKGASVFYNGRRMKEADANSRFGNHYYYLRCSRAEAPPRMRILATGYQPFDDTVYAFADIRLMPVGQRDYYYDHIKVPCKRYPGRLFSRVPDRVPPDSLVTEILGAGGEMVDSFLICSSWKDSQEEPQKDALVYCLPPTAAGDSLKAWLYHFGATGPYVEVPSSGQPRTGFRDHFTIQLRPACQEDALNLLQFWKDRGRLRWYGRDNPYEPSRLRIQVAPEEVEAIVQAIDALLATGYFFDPVMELHQFICPA